MSTIRDVAKAAGVSITTVSLIINGKAEERKISAATCQRVTAAMKELGYQPNLTARRLRSQNSRSPVIALFWPLDYRTPILASFLNSFQLEIQRLNFDCELVVQTYENDKLERCSPAIIKNGYNGIIVGGCSRKDQEYLEQISPQMPVVLLNRTSERFSTVYVDHEKVGFQAANLFRRCGYSQAAVIASEHSYVATGLRVQAFLDACARVGITVAPEHILKGASTIEGGRKTADRYCRLSNPPKAIFCDYDAMAIGVLRAFYDHCVRIPEDVEILSIAMLEPESALHTIPSLSVIEMPNRAIGKTVIDLLQEKISTNSLEPSHVNMEAPLILRESFPLEFRKISIPRHLDKKNL